MTDELRDCYDSCDRDIIHWDRDMCYDECDKEFKREEDEE